MNPTLAAGEPESARAGPRPCGRFAPTPSGPLHFGSLVSALAGALDAKSRGGAWFVRIDDLDGTRRIAGAAKGILSDLERLGFEWDGPVQYQAPRSERYREAAVRLRAAGHAFDCACSRREIAAAGRTGSEGPVYPGTCRKGVPAGRRPRSLRLRVPRAPLEFVDEWRGAVRQDLANSIGDFVIWRADGIAAYHLATVLDDADLGVNRVVRGLDLLASTPRQILLQRLLGLPQPAYAHHALALENGRKLGKQTHAPRVDTRRAPLSLVAALEFLGQAPPTGLAAAGVSGVWHWALAHWNAAAAVRP